MRFSYLWAMIPSEGIINIGHAVVVRARVRVGDNFCVSFAEKLRAVARFRVEKLRVGVVAEAALIVVVVCAVIVTSRLVAHRVRLGVCGP